MDKNKILENIKMWANELGDIQKEYFLNKNFEIENKSTGIDLVTKIDKQSEKMLREKIEKNYPDHSILGEEDGFEDKKSDYRWIIDPLDGTTNYAQGLPIYAISIALEYKGVTIIGLVHSPSLNQTFWAIKDEGAYLNGKKLKVGNKNTLRESVIATGFPYDRAENPDNNVKYFAQILPKVRGIRRMGAAAYDLANVAAGNLDGYWELNLGLWDVAAGILLVEEAGGLVIPWDGKRGIAIIAGNREICDIISKELKKV